MAPMAHVDFKDKRGKKDHQVRVCFNTKLSVIYDVSLWSIANRTKGLLIILIYLGISGEVAYYQDLAISGDRGLVGLSGKDGSPGEPGLPGPTGPAGTHTHLNAFTYVSSVYSN